MTTSYDKLEISLRYWLQGRRYFLALKAMDYAKKFHTGLRKDGVTPEFSHQVWIVNLLRTLESSLSQPEITLAAGFLHDVCEDYHVSFEEIAQRFGMEVAEAVRRLTKKHRGIVLPPQAYYDGVAECQVASLVKGVDRSHNLGTMVGVFTFQKQVLYIAEVRDLILPALKRARRAFPEQEAAYENIKQGLLSRISLIEAIHQAARSASQPTALQNA